MHASYGWIITHDHVAADAATDTAATTAVGTTGPENIDPAILARLLANEGLQFRTRDSDGHVDLRGLYLHPAGDQGADVTSFAPLDDYARGSVGSVEIQYFLSGGWRTL